MDEWSFSVEELTKLGRENVLPPGYIDRLRARQLLAYAAVIWEIIKDMERENGSNGAILSIPYSSL
jgi:hypothetical protein